MHHLYLSKIYLAMYLWILSLQFFLDHQVIKHLGIFNPYISILRVISRPNWMQFFKSNIGVHWNCRIS